MIRRLFNIIFILFAIVLILFFIIFLITASWLNNYRAFTKRTEIGEIKISKQMQDEIGQYTDVELVQYQPQNAVSSIFVFNEDKKDLPTSQTFRLYGDEIAIAGPFIKMKDVFLLSNFSNAYKLGRLTTQYNNPDQEKVRNEEKTPSRFELNGGFSDWKETNDTYNSNTPLGYWYKFLFDTFTIQSAGVFQPASETTYKIYVTSAGFTFDKK